MANSIAILEEVFSYFARDPIGPLLNLDRVAEDSKNPIRVRINEQISLFDATTIAKIKEDQHFLFFYGTAEGADHDRNARLWALKQLLSENIPKARLRALTDSTEMMRPHPMSTQLLPRYNLIMIAWYHSTLFVSGQEPYCVARLDSRFSSRSNQQIPNTG